MATWDGRSMHLSMRSSLLPITICSKKPRLPLGRGRGLRKIAKGNGNRAITAIFRMAGRKGHPTSTLSMANRIAPRGSEVVLASAMDHAGEAFREQVQGLASRTDVRIIRISDAFEMDPPSGRYRFATRDRPEGREGRPMAADQTDRTAGGLNIPVEVWHSARAPEAQHHG